MRKPAIHQPVFIFLCVMLCLLPGLLPLQAQGQNLLQNPGFEPPFTTLDGQPPRQVANGWVPWHVPAPAGSPSYFNVQPEYYPAAPDAARIRSGSDAQMILSFFAVHTGGVYQRVTGVTAGTTYRFSVYAYAWSSVFDDVDLSEEDGDVFVSVGIDPTGGTDGQSVAIVWSQPVEMYDSYNAYTVDAAATGSSVTVFVRTTAGVPVKHNNIYLDDASLVAVGDQPGAATATTQAPATNTSVPAASATPTTDSSSFPPGFVTPTPEGMASDTPVPATSTSVPPTATSVPPTATAMQPSATPVVPTATAVVTTPMPAPGTATPTLVPPTATFTMVPPSSTPIPPTATPPTPISDEFPGTITHTVRRGETVSVLATRYGSSVQAIASANGLGSNYLIFVGQELIIPVRLSSPATSTPTLEVVFVTATPPQPVPPLGSNNVYVVMPGDTLTRIARLFNTTVDALAQLNGIVNVNQIQVGQQLIVPTSSDTVQPTVQPPSEPQPPTPEPAPMPVIYIVRPGDTLQRISLQFGVPIWVIAQANNIQNINRIFVGQALIVP